MTCGGQPLAPRRRGPQEGTGKGDTEEAHPVIQDGVGAWPSIGATLETAAVPRLHVWQSGHLKIVFLRREGLKPRVKWFQGKTDASPRSSPRREQLFESILRDFRFRQEEQKCWDRR